MKATFSIIIKYLPLLAGIAILAIAIPLVPWSKVGPALIRLGWQDYLALFILSLVYYFGRILRYWLMLRLLNQATPMSKVATAVIVAQPVSVLPAGEIYRSTMLKRYGNVATVEGAPSVFAQSIAESVGLLIIALVGAAFLHKYTGILLGFAVVFTALIAGVRWHDVNRTHRWLNKLPAVNFRLKPFRRFMDRNRVLMSFPNFIYIIAASYVSTGAGIIMVYVASHGVGAHLTLLQSVVGYTLPMVLETASFLPGGLGVNEGSSASLFTLFGASFAQAVAITIIVRLTTLGMGFPLGFAALGWAKLRNYRHFD